MDNRKLERSLKQKFHFMDDDARGDSHRYMVLELPSGLVVRTHISHSRGDIPTPILSKVCKQLHVKMDVLNRMVECTVSRDEYYQILDNDAP
jgi:hypothetical protein